MRVIEASGETYKQALKSGLKELKATEEFCFIETVEEGKKGFFKERPFKLKISLNTEKIMPLIKRFMENALKAFGDLNETNYPSYKLYDEKIIIKLSDEHCGFFSRNNCEPLIYFQMLLDAYSLKEKIPMPVLINCCDFLEKRYDFIKSYTDLKIKKVKHENKKQEINIDLMSFDRDIILKAVSSEGLVFKAVQKAGAKIYEIRPS